jgi:hypothetical protein
MSQDFILWKHQVRLALRGLCTLDFPRGAHGTNANDADFRAAMRGLYVKSYFTKFLACEAWRQAGLSDSAGKALHTSRRMPWEIARPKNVRRVRLGEKASPSAPADCVCPPFHLASKPRLCPAVGAFYSTAQLPLSWCWLIYIFIQA